MWVENNEGKEEIAPIKQFLLFPQYFQDINCRQGKPVLVWQRIKYIRCLIKQTCHLHVFKNYTFSLQVELI